MKQKTLTIIGIIVSLLQTAFELLKGASERGELTKKKDNDKFRENFPEDVPNASSSSNS